jgi:hypothetical protein
MEKILFEVIRPYLISRPDILVTVIILFFLITYVRWNVKMYFGWLSRHDTEFVALERKHDTEHAALERKLDDFILKTHEHFQELGEDLKYYEGKQNGKDRERNK